MQAATVEWGVKEARGTNETQHRGDDGDAGHDQRVTAGVNCPW